MRSRRRPSGGRRAEELRASRASVVQSRSQAAAIFKQFRTGFEQPSKALTKGTTYVFRLSGPRYGDEQMATYHPADGGKLLVRRNTVAWFLQLQDLSSEQGSRILTKAEAAAELKKYGRKQQQHVGSG